MTSPLHHPTTGAPSPYAPAADTRHAIDDALLARARALGPLIREHADATERDRRIARPVLDAMREAGLLRMLTPRALGGLEADPVTVARVVEEVASHDAVAGWTLQAGNTGAWWASRCPAAGVEELFAGGPDLVMAASFMPPHPAEVVPGGFRISGQGALASTVHDSTWLMLTGLVHDGGQPRMTPQGPELVSLVLRTRDVEIVDTWHSLGMRGTDSNDVVARDVFVPESRSFRLVPAFTPTPAFAGPLYRLPASASVTLVLVPVALAIARGAIEAMRALGDRRTPVGATRTMRHRAAVQAALGDAEATLRSARLYFLDTVAATWRLVRDGATPTLEQRADLMLAGAHAARSAVRAVELAHRMCGTAGIYARHPLERHLRDILTLRHHAFVCEGRLETAGQVYLGVEPEFPMVAF